MRIRPYTESDVPAMIALWNEVVEDGRAFPQTEPLDGPGGGNFFAGQSRSAVAEIDGKIVGLYILHPNNVGRCGHIANASYAVDRDHRCAGIGRALVEDSLAALADLGFRGLQFNAVVASNEGAIHLYEDLGFRRVGIIEGGFRSDSSYEDIFIYFHPAPSAASSEQP